MGREMVVMLRAAPMVIESAWVAVCGVGDVASVVLTVKLKVPVVVGVPKIFPLLFRLRPVGSAPVVRDQE